MKIATVGAKFYGGQLDRIERGFEKLGHTLTPHWHEADLIYANNPWYDQIVVDKEAGRLRGKIIMNVLDIPEHIIGEFDTRKLTHQLMAADAVTAISKWTRDKVSEYCSMEPFVIYNPIKPVFHDPSLRVESGKFYRFAHGGRRSDPNKRAIIGFLAMDMLGFVSSDLCLFGEEPFPYGDHLGVLSDGYLNRVYNNVDFVFATGKIEGMGLTAIEAMACGAIPVICNDLTTGEEFFPSSVFPEYDEVCPNPVSIAHFISEMLRNKDHMDEMKTRLVAHFQKNWGEKLSGEGVAKAIIGVYDRIK